MNLTVALACLAVHFGHAAIGSAFDARVLPAGETMFEPLQEVPLVRAAGCRRLLVPASTRLTQCSRRVAFDPDYGAPFADLGWRGEAIVDYGTCDGPGTVTNLPGSCNGGLSFQSATVQLYKPATRPTPTLQTLTFTGGASGLVDLRRFQ